MPFLLNEKYFVSHTRIQENFFAVSKMQLKTVFKSDFLCPLKMHGKRRNARFPIIARGFDRFIFVQFGGRTVVGLYC